MDQLAHTLKLLAERLFTLLFSFGSTISLSSLGCAALIAAGVVAYRLRRKGRRVRAGTLFRALLPGRYFRHPSSHADFAYMLFNVFTYPLIFGAAVLSYRGLSEAVLSGLSFLFGPARSLGWPVWICHTLATLAAFLAYELGYWIDHALKHRVPALWELHKVHHTAEVLTPVSVFRMHPLDSLIFGNIMAAMAALAGGAMQYVFAGTVSAYTIGGTNLILIVFMHLYVHLQHTELWLPLSGPLGRVFLSPAHHQLHHSADPAHFDRNFGSCLALWDWLFGTLNRPQRTRPPLRFGLGEAYADAHGIGGLLWRPVGQAAARIGQSVRQGAQRNPARGAAP
jgi:sterol desaturase/sphingolipid hydroxylase (fatty acid hydroxylase superfamily)